MKYLWIILLVTLVSCEDESKYYDCKDSNRILMKEFVEKCIEKGTQCIGRVYTEHYNNVVRNCSFEAKKLFCMEPKNLGK